MVKDLKPKAVGTNKYAHVAVQPQQKHQYFLHKYFLSVTESWQVYPVVSLPSRKNGLSDIIGGSIWGFCSPTTVSAAADVSDPSRYRFLGVQVHRSL